MKLLLYCTKANRYDKLLVNNKDLNCIFLNQSKAFYYDDWKRFKHLQILNGTIPCECDYEVEEIYPFYKDFECEDIFYEIPNKLDFDDLLKKSCLDNQQLDDYLYANKGYAIHIKNLHIFDKPRKLNEYYHLDTYMLSVIKQAPQNMMYVDDANEKKVLISIRPEWLCKILNGEKTIEVRKKVLKEML